MNDAVPGCLSTLFHLLHWTRSDLMKSLWPVSQNIYVNFVQPTSMCGILRDFPGQRPSLVQSLFACFKSWIVMLNLKKRTDKNSFLLFSKLGTSEQCLLEYHPPPPHTYGEGYQIKNNVCGYVIGWQYRYRIGTRDLSLSVIFTHSVKLVQLLAAPLHVP